MSLTPPATSGFGAISLTCPAERPAGFAPTGVYNPQEIPIQYFWFVVNGEFVLILQAVHRLRPPASDMTWGKAFRCWKVEPMELKTLWRLFLNLVLLPKVL